MLTLPLCLGAFIAGVLMFLAPCTLPIVPGYLAFIAAVPAGEAAKERRKLLLNAAAFVLGFAVVFVALGASAGLFGFVIGSWRWALARAGGLIIALFGLIMLGLWRVPYLSGERHIPLPSFAKMGRPSSSALIGGLFALGWSPCIGPILGTILFAASASSTAASGALLLAIFSLGLALPFLAVALLMARAERFVVRFSRTSQVLSRIGGVFLLVLGILILFNEQGLLVAWGFSLFNSIGYDRLLNYM